MVPELRWGWGGEGEKTHQQGALAWIARRRSSHRWTVASGTGGGWPPAWSMPDGTIADLTVAGAVYKLIADYGNGFPADW